ncbi:MAG TPA: flagellar basal body L-ring protein FlgH [Burkholderiaceae bacterium]|nr:flagellar basal body L-ring protein FlgH [Burkholderiaceae bacterium]
MRTAAIGIVGLWRTLMAGALVAAALGAGGCAALNPTPKVQVYEPTTTRSAPVPQVAAAEPAGNGSIYRVGAFRPLFEDRRARLVGDVLTIQIAEKTSAKQSSASNLDRSGKAEGSITALPFLPSSSLGRMGLGGSSANTFGGKGDTASDNTFQGTITVTVIEVLPNGNMLVSGEKQVGINQNVDTLRFSGVVTPASIQPNNTVLSTQVADARLQVRGSGDIDRAQTTGWLARFFLSWLPI